MWIVYGLVCKRDGKAYIGMTSNLEKRLKKHKTMFNTKSHDNYLLRGLSQFTSWNEFDIIELEQVDDYDMARSLEWFWIWTWEGGTYNVNRRMPFNVKDECVELMRNWAKELDIPYDDTAYG